MNSTVTNYIRKGIVGAITEESFDAYMKGYRAVVRDQAVGVVCARRRRPSAWSRRIFTSPAVAPINRVLGFWS